MCFLLPSDATSGITLLTDGSFEVWSDERSQTTRSLTTAIAFALAIAHESFFSMRRNIVDPLGIGNSNVANVGDFSNHI